MALAAALGVATDAFGQPPTLDESGAKKLVRPKKQPVENEPKSPAKRGRPKKAEPPPAEAKDGPAKGPKRKGGAK